MESALRILAGLVALVAGGEGVRRSSAATSRPLAGSPRRRLRGGYTAYLVLQATEHRALGPFNAVMLPFVLPLTAVTVAVVTIRSLRAGR